MIIDQSIVRLEAIHITPSPHLPITPFRLVLASASPRRAQLLADAGYRFDVRPVEVDERVKPNEAPSSYVRRLAMEKSERAMAVHGADDVVILAADTAVILDTEILGKPQNDADAELMLRKLSGRSHEVLTGVSLRTVSSQVDAVETTRVWFAPLSASEIDWYVASGEGADKAGGYGIQGLAARFVTRIDGSYSNVVGLPIAKVHQLLDALAENRR